MQTLADYQTLSDGSFTLDNNAGSDEKTLTVTLPDDLHTSTFGILMYTANPSGTVTKHYEVDINDVTDVSVDVSSDEVRSMHEAINMGLLKVGANTVQFRYESGSGSISFSNVVLMYQRNAGT